MADDLDIPASAFKIKADYFDRPDKATIALIKDYIHKFGTPHLWWGHTHTVPMPISAVYLSADNIPFAIYNITRM